MKGLMPRSRLNEAERGAQDSFSFQLWPTLLLIAFIGGFGIWVSGARPDRSAQPPRTVTLRMEPIAFRPGSALPLRQIGAWRMTADDRRFGGLSALAIDRDGLIALSDSGALFRFGFPGGPDRTVTIAELPDGPGSPDRKKNRDSEALVIDPAGRGWWVAFESRNAVWLYDRGFDHAIRWLGFGAKRWPVNVGIEAMVAEPGRILLIPEQAREVVTVIGRSAASRPLDGAGSHISDAIRLPDGEIVVLLRRVGLTGFVNQLGVLVETSTGGRIERRMTLDVGALTNLEGMAIERRSGGGSRLWLVSDDNFQRPLETRLLAFDLPSGGWPEAN